MRKKHRVLLPGGIPIDAMVVRRVEVISIDPPCFVEDLIPFGAGIDSYFDVVDVYLACAGLRLGRDSDYRPNIVAGVENLLLVSGHQVVPDPRDERVVLAFVEVVLMKRRFCRARSEGIVVGRTLDVVELTRRA